MDEVGHLQMEMDEIHLAVPSLSSSAEVLSNAP